MEEARISGEEHEQRAGRKILGVDLVHAGVRWPMEMYLIRELYAGTRQSMLLANVLRLRII